MYSISNHEIPAHASITFDGSPPKPAPKQSNEELDTRSLTHPIPNPNKYHPTPASLPQRPNFSSSLFSSFLFLSPLPNSALSVLSSPFLL